MKSILVTGATGFLGPSIVKTLAKSGRHIVALTRLRSDVSRLRVDIPNIVTRLTDGINLLARDSLYDIFDEFDFDGVIHLSTYYAKEHDQEDIAPMVWSNITFPLQILNLAIQHKVKWFINTGTGAEYAPSLTPMEDNEIVDPQNLYARTKVMFDHGARFLMRDEAMSYLTLLLFSPYGPGEKGYKLIPSIIRCIMNQTPFTIDAPDQRLDLTYSDDIANAYLKAVELVEREKMICERVSIGSGHIVKIRDVASMLEGIVGVSGPITYGSKDTGTLGNYPSIDKANWLLNWKSTTSLREGLKLTVDSIRSCI